MVEVALRQTTQTPTDLPYWLIINTLSSGLNKRKGTKRLMGFTRIEEIIL